ncbi:MAG: hypothetical protein FWD39_03410, partial [Clostridiales bacterium]|nr:hypothetical protein [Clostridiales bacterium]
MRSSLRNINNGTMPWRAQGAYFKLTADIDLTTYLSQGNPGYNSGKGWVPIGNTNWPFMGIFDGDGHKITGLYINNATLPTAGLFGVMKGTVQNLGVEGVDIHGGMNVAAIVGTLSGGKVLTSYATGAVNGTTGVGGIAGVVDINGAVRQCYVTGSVSGNSAVGGIGGYIFSGIVENCYTKCSVTASGDGAGGIVGNDASTGAISTIDNCYATGAVSGGQDLYSTTGGIMGKQQNIATSAINCVAINPKISGYATLTARITGMKSGTLSHNYAITEIKNANDITTSWTNKTHNDKGGADINVSDVLNGSWWRDKNHWDLPGWDENVWLIEDGKLPILKGVGGDQDGRLPDGLIPDISSAVAAVTPASYVYTGGVINPASVSVVLNGATLAGGTDYTWAITSVDGAGTSAGRKVGTVTITITGQGAYRGTLTKTYEITPAPLTVTVNSGQYKLFGANDPALTYTASGWQGSDGNALLAGSLTREPGNAIGSYNILRGTLVETSGNYTLTYVGAQFEIRRLSITDTDPKLSISGIGASYEYTGSDIRPVPSVVYDGVTLTAGTDYDVSYSNNKNAGTMTAAVTITFKGGYDGAVTKNFSITKAALTVTAHPGLSKTFGDGDPVFTYTAGGWKGTDGDALLSGALSRQPGEAAGFYNILIGALTETSGNYTISFTGAQFEIKTREIVGTDPKLSIS